MNVKDVPSPILEDLIPSEVSRIIMDRQADLESKYWQIECRYAPQVEINSAKGQVLIKDFLWRAMEEVGEAIEALEVQGDVEKCNEEFADGLHFVSGLCHIVNRRTIFTGAFESYFNIPRAMLVRSSRTHSLVYRAGVLGNTLKMKPWKQSAITTDIPEFTSKLYDYVEAYLWAWGAPLHMVYDYYWRKSEVNLFRIRSNY